MIMQGHPEQAVPDLFITQELARRPAVGSDHRCESLAMQDLASRMAAEPEAVLPRFVELAMQMTGGDSAGITLLEGTPKSTIFHWKYLKGSLATFEGVTTPRDFSPCGVTLDREAPTLSRRPERVYDWIADAGLTVPEVLLVPLYVGAAPLGTLWIVSEKEGHFDSGHARAMTELSTFVGIALKMTRTERALSQALEEQQIIAKEMGHRVKNVFAMTDSMIRMSLRRATSKDDLAQSLSGRIQALARSHSLVRRDFGDAALQDQGADLAGLIATIVQPHEIAEGRKRFFTAGPPLHCGAHTANNIALVFHELATNAAKYGALLTESGQVGVRWEIAAGALRLTWSERGGPAIAEAPEDEGFGSSLVRRTIRQLGGSLEHAWRPEGLEATMTLPLAALTG